MELVVRLKLESDHASQRLADGGDAWRKVVQRCRGAHAEIVRAHADREFPNSVAHPFPLALILWADVAICFSSLFTQSKVTERTRDPRSLSPQALGEMPDRRQCSPRRPIPSNPLRPRAL